MNKLKQLWSWLVVSSVNPENTALTVKGFLVGIVPLLLLVSNGLGLHSVSQGSLQDLINTIVALVQNVLGLVALAMTVWGLVRKLWMTFFAGPSA